MTGQGLAVSGVSFSRDRIEAGPPFLLLPFVFGLVSELVDFLFFAGLLVCPKLSVCCFVSFDADTFLCAVGCVGVSSSLGCTLVIACDSVYLFIDVYDIANIHSV